MLLTCPAPPESIILSVPVGFMLQKKKRNKGKKEGGDEQGRATFQQCAKNGHGNDHLTWRGVLACCFFWMRHVYSS